MAYTKPIPSQDECDPTKPDEHFLWALRNLPSFAGSGMITHSGFLRKWSEHLWRCGFIHRDYLAGKADEDGKIDVKYLPEQQIRFQEAFRGPHHTYNNAARWVSQDEAEPEPVVIPNINELTEQERHALLYQYEREGLIPKNPTPPPVAEVFNEKEDDPDDDQPPANP